MGKFEQLLIKLTNGVTFFNVNCSLKKGALSEKRLINTGLSILGSEKQNA